MLTRPASCLVALFAGSSAAMACGGAPICTVADPTGTPLNIRMSPAGPVIGSAKNGTRLAFLEHREVDGSTWALVERFHDGELAADFEGAWVFGSYLTCDGPTLGLPQDPYSGITADAVSCTVADPTGTPLNARTDPGGAIFATLRNGTVVRAIARTQLDGAQWLFVEKWSGDNAVGWVFDAYMTCEEQESH